MSPRIDPEALCAITLEAGRHALQLRTDGLLEPEHKIDGTPVTQADFDSQAIILRGLAALTPDIPVIAEEKDNSDLLARKTYWLVDPLDGTRDFITGRDDFSVNIGLVIGGVPTVGVIYAPARDDLVFGAPDETFRIKRGQREQLVAHPSQSPPRLVISVRDVKKNPTEDWIKTGLVASVAVHASAYKIALIATGEADLFLRTGATYEWDTAAGDAILRAQGGKIATPDGKPLGYGKRHLTNGLLVAYRKDFDEETLKELWESIVGLHQT